MKKLSCLFLSLVLSIGNTLSCNNSNLVLADEPTYTYNAEYQQFYTNIPYDYNDFGYVHEFHNVILGQVIDLTKVYVNGVRLKEWFYDSDLTVKIDFPEVFVVSEYVVENGIYNHFSNGSVNIANGSENYYYNQGNLYLYYNPNIGWVLANATPTTAGNYLYTSYANIFKIPPTNNIYNPEYNYLYYDYSSGSWFVQYKLG